MTIHEPLPAPAATEQAPFLTSQMLSAELGVPEDTIRGWRSSRRGPVFHKLGGLIRYRREDVDAWLRSCRIETEQTDDHEEDPGDDA